MDTRTISDRENRVLLDMRTRAFPKLSPQLDRRRLTLGEIGGATQTAFSQTIQAAKSYALAQNYGAAQGQLSVARGLQAQLGGGYGQDSIDYVQSILDGDQGAHLDARAGDSLLASAQGRQGTGVDVNPDRGTFMGDVTKSGTGIFDSIAKLETPIKIAGGLAALLLVVSVLKR